MDFGHYVISVVIWCWWWQWWIRWIWDLKPTEIHWDPIDPGRNGSIRMSNATRHQLAQLNCSSGASKKTTTSNTAAAYRLLPTAPVKLRPSFWLLILSPNLYNSIARFNNLFHGRFGLNEWFFFISHINLEETRSIQNHSSRKCVKQSKKRKNRVFGYWENVAVGLITRRIIALKF